MAPMYITNPLAGQQMANLFSTHPPVRERIRRLQAYQQPNPRPADLEHAQSTHRRPSCLTTGAAGDAQGASPARPRESAAGTPAVREHRADDLADTLDRGHQRGGRGW
jgi:predicted Zn-dependent protease